MVEDVRRIDPKLNRLRIVDAERLAQVPIESPPPERAHCQRAEISLCSRRGVHEKGNPETRAAVGSRGFERYRSLSVRRHYLGKSEQRARRLQTVRGRHIVALGIREHAVLRVTETIPIGAVPL